jgi:hypothetical protein
MHHCGRAAEHPGKGDRPNSTGSSTDERGAGGNTGPICCGEPAWISAAESAALAAHFATSQNGGNRGDAGKSTSGPKFGKAAIVRMSSAKAAG